MLAEDVCRRADDLIEDARARRHGLPKVGDVATLWSAYLDRSITARDVGIMMVLLRLGCATGSFDLDDYVDVAAYAGIAAELYDDV